MWYKVIMTSQGEFIVYKVGLTAIVCVFQFNHVTVPMKINYDSAPDRDIQFVEWDVPHCHDLLRKHETSLN